ncbi:CDGSH iron-sulfur domain-containing protein [Metapseudomonas boanensis]|uniref:CDGSH iron-sulfur domain-containing protein n=1 Tax=Metapseudomonas boanensis TaxID=2822138 RepID=UPI00203D2A60|nr:CDGSH iron-sulfur domain-containing protein [Pseudomonas boanensis]
MFVGSVAATVPPGDLIALPTAPDREQFLLLCCCGHSARLPCCDGSHNLPTSSLGQR